MKTESIVAFIAGFVIVWVLLQSKHNSSVTLTSSQPAVVDAKPVETQEETPVMAEVVVVEVKQVEPSILMHSSSDCVHCDRWWSQRADWEKLGWRVEKVIDIAPVEGHRVWPWFKIRDRDVEFTVDGFMDGDRFKAARKKALIR